MGEALSPETVKAAQLLADQGWKVEGPAGVLWEPAFKPQFYKAGGDAEGEVYCRIDLPESLYYALQDAAREGAKAARQRLAHFRDLEQSVGEQERAGAPPTVGLLDGLALTAFELRCIIVTLNDVVRRYDQALDRADTRRHKA